MAKKDTGAVEKRSRAVVKKGENHDFPALGTENSALKPKAKTKAAAEARAKAKAKAATDEPAKEVLHPDQKEVGNENAKPGGVSLVALDKHIEGRRINIEGAWLTATGRARLVPGKYEEDMECEAVNESSEAGWYPARWWHDVAVQPAKEAPVEPRPELQLPEGFSIARARAALHAPTAAERAAALELAFHWWATPQGISAWYGQYIRVKDGYPLDREFATQLRAWISIASPRTAVEPEPVKDDAATDPGPEGWLPPDFRVDAAEKALTGELQPNGLPWLVVAFGFKDTPQGMAFWLKESERAKRGNTPSYDGQNLLGHWIRRAKAKSAPPVGLDAHGVDLEAPEPAKASRPWWLVYVQAAAFVAGWILGSWLFLEIWQLVRNWKGGDA
jgi:hypothetical protein